MELFLTFPSNLLSILLSPSIHNGLSRVDDFGLVRSDTAIQVNFGLKGTRREHVGLLFRGGAVHD